MENEDLPRPFGPYTLLDGLGRGGMGQVYLALRDGLAGVTQLSVIKTLRTQHASDAEYISRFEDEAKTVVQLSHRNIAQVFDVGIIDGTYYMAMELVRGVDLDTLNKRASAGGGLPPGEAVYIISEALEALGYAHRFKDPLTGDPLNIVHRDVSPHNVMVSYEGEVKLIDFGLSASTLKKTETAPQVVMGKLLYMAPEQARDDPLDGRCDLYAMGIMLAELLSRRRYYEGMSAQSVWAQVGTGFRSPVLDQLPPVFADICTKATHPDVNARYPSADAFRAELLKAARDHGWHSGSTELRGTLGTMLRLEEEAFRNRVRDAVNKSVERAPVRDRTVVTQQHTQVTTIASALGSPLSSTSSGDATPDSDSGSGVYAPSSPAPSSPAPSSAPPSLASAPEPAVDVPEPRTGDTAVLALSSFDTDVGDPVEALPPEDPTEQDGAPVVPVAAAPPPQETVRLLREAPQPSKPLSTGSRRAPLLLAGVGAATLVLSVVVGVVVLDEGDVTPSSGPTSVTDLAPSRDEGVSNTVHHRAEDPGDQGIDPLIDPLIDTVVDDGEGPAAPEPEAAPTDDEAPEEAPEEDPPTPEPEQATPDPDAKEPEATATEARQAKPARTSRPAKTARGARGRKASRNRGAGSRTSRSKASRRTTSTSIDKQRPSERPPSANAPLADVQGYLKRHCRKEACFRRSVRQVSELPTQEIPKLFEEARQCVKTCYGR